MNQQPADPSRKNRSSTSPRVRPDLQWVQYDEQPATRWVARDPLNQSFFYFSSRERRMVELLDGKQSLHEIVQRWNIVNPMDFIDVETLKRFVIRLYRSGLLLSQEIGFHDRLIAQEQSRQRQGWLALILNPISIRIPLFDPSPLLNRLIFLGRYIFQPSTAIFLLIAIALTLLGILGQWDRLQYHIPKVEQLIAGDRVIWLMIAYVGVKSLHELGHALACRSYGAQCHEIGIMLLVFTPSPYCDVSDSWRLNNRWHRAMIAAAGIYIELFLAIVAANVWVNSHPGTLNILAFNIMVICSVGTVLINANPLLRYDGYYIFSDLLGVPNLTDQAREALWGPLQSWLKGRSFDSRGLDAPIWVLATYGLLSTIYRWLLLVGILWGIHQLLVPMGMAPVAGLLTCTILMGVAWSAYQMTKNFVRSSLMKGTIRMSRLAIVLGVLGVIGWMFVSFPLPSWVSAPAIVRYETITPLFAQDTGQLVRSVSGGTRVKTGEVIAELDSPEQRLQKLELTGEIDLLEFELKQLRTISILDPSAAAEIPSTEELLTKRRDQLATVTKNLAGLTVQAPFEGIIIDPPATPEPPSNEKHLVRWSGVPLSARNQHCVIERGEFLGWLGDEKTLVVEAFVSERDSETLVLGSEVRVRFDSHPDVTLTGKLIRLAPDAVEAIPNELAGDPRIPARRSESGKTIPEDPHYIAQIELNEAPQFVHYGALASTHITIGSSTLAERLLRYIRQTVRLDWPTGQ